MMLKDHHHHMLRTFFQNFWRRVSKSSSNNGVVKVQRLTPNSHHQHRSRNNFLFVNSPIPKLSAHQVPSLIRRSGTGTAGDNYKQWRKMGWYNFHIYVPILWCDLKIKTPFQFLISLLSFFIKNYDTKTSQNMHCPWKCHFFFCLF